MRESVLLDTGPLVAGCQPGEHCEAGSDPYFRLPCTSRVTSATPSSRAIQTRE
jgi:hypothetical protein